MLKLLADIDNFILSETYFLCEYSNTTMIYTYKNNDNYTITFIIHTLMNKNLWLIIKENDNIRVIVDEFSNFEQFKNFFSREFNEYLL